MSILSIFFNFLLAQSFIFSPFHTLSSLFLKKLDKKDIVQENQALCYEQQLAPIIRHYERHTPVEVPSSQAQETSMSYEVPASFYQEEPTLHIPLAPTVDSIPQAPTQVTTIKEANAIHLVIPSTDHHVIHISITPKELVQPVEKNASPVTPASTPTVEKKETPPTIEVKPQTKNTEKQPIKKYKKSKTRHFYSKKEPVISIFEIG